MSLSLKTRSNTGTRLPCCEAAQNSRKAGDSRGSSICAAEAAASHCCRRFAVLWCCYCTTGTVACEGYSYTGCPGSGRATPAVAGDVGVLCEARTKSGRRDGFAVVATLRPLTCRAWKRRQPALSRPGHQGCASKHPFGHAAGGICLRLFGVRLEGR